MIIQSLKLIKKFLLLYPPAENLKTRKGDIFIVSYPKSGNTWVRALLMNYFYPKSSFHKIDKKIPDIYKISKLRSYLMFSKRIFKSHESVNSNYAKVIYIVRNPISVCFSYENFSKNIEKRKFVNFNSYLNNFLTGKLDRFGSWSNHVEGWFKWGNKNRVNFHLVRYEDLVNDPHSELGKIITFLNEKVDNEKINNTIKINSFSNLKLKENNGQLNWKSIDYNYNGSFFYKRGNYKKDPRYSKVQKIITYKWANSMKIFKY